MGRNTRAFAVLVVLAALGGACGSDDSGEDAGSGGAAESAEAGGAAEGSSAGECTEDLAGGELTFGAMAETRGLDPAVGSPRGTQSGTEMTALYDTLVRYDNESGEFEPHLAESLEPSDDLTEWTLTLRDGVRFGNGEPLDAAAVEFTVNRHLAEDTLSSLGPTVAIIETMEVVDDRTITFRLSAPWGEFPALLAGSVGMVVDPGTVEARGADAFASDPTGAGAGPYELVRYAPGEELVLEAKDDYWDGPVCIEQLRFVTIAGAEGTYEAFRNGELDVAMLRSPDVLAQATDDGVPTFTSLAHGGGMIMINNGARGVDRPGADVRVRQAIAHALDVDLIDERVRGGLGMPTSALVHEDSVLSTGVEGPAHDPERAEELVDEVKAETGWDGSLHFVCSNTPESEELAITVQGLLTAVGFQVELDNSRTTDDFASLITDTADYDIACHSLSLTDAAPWTRLFRRIGDGDSPSSSIGYVDPDMDEALDALMAAGSVDERRDAMAQVQEVWNETVPSAPYEAIPESVIWQDDVEGLQFSQDALVLFDDAHVGG
jgi:peptide/nickel transport system substrate-binding protein